MMLKLLKLRLFTTSACNLCCSYCFIDHTKFKYGNIKTMLAACRWAVTNFSDYQLLISFTGGGEPLLCAKLIAEVIEKLQERYPDNNFLYGITTNGTLFSDWQNLLSKYADRFSVTLSYDGDKFTQNKQRDNSFDDIPLEKWLPYIDGVSMTVVSESLNSLYNNFVYLVTRGVEHISISVDYSALSQADSVIYDQQLHQIKNYILKLYSDAGKLIILDCFYRCEKTFDGKYKLTEDYEEENFSIDYDGNIIRCQSSLLDFNKGKIFRIKKEDVLIGNVYTPYDRRDSLVSCCCYKDVGEIKKCKNCPAYLTCVKCKELFNFVDDKEAVCRIIRIEHKHIKDYLDRLQKIRDKMKYNQLQIADIFLTERCNLKCDYCYVKQENGKDIDEKTLIKAINFGFDSSSEELTFWLFGGEPFLNVPLLLKAIALILKKNKKFKKKLHITVLTNGTVFDDTFAKFWSDHACISLQISLDGLRQAHDSHRKFSNGRGSFNIVFTNISRYLNYRKDLHVRMTITPESVFNLSESFLALLNKGIRSMAICPVHEVNWSKKDVAVYKDEYKKITSLIAECLKNKEAIYFSNMRFDTIQQQVPCGAGRYFMAIDVEGNIYPCHRFKYLDRDFKIGNVLKGLDKSKLKPYENLVLADISECNKCQVNNCDTCIAMNYQLNGDIKNGYRSNYCELSAIHEAASKRLFVFISELYTWAEQVNQLENYPFIKSLIYSSARHNQSSAGA